MNDMKPMAKHEEQQMSHAHMDHNHMGDHHDHHMKMAQDMLIRFIVCLVLTIPILFLSHMLQGFIKVDWSFYGDKYIVLVLASAIFGYGSWPFFKGTYTEIKHKAPAMMTLVALATSVSYIYSTAVVFGLPGDDLYWELATLVDIMLLGHWLEMKSSMAAQGSMTSLSSLLPKQAHLLQTDGTTKAVASASLKPNDQIIVKAGEKIPADGVVISGISSVDESLVTGESIPVNKKQGAKVIGGTANGEGTLTIKVTKTGQDSFAAQVQRLVEQALSSKSKAQRLADIAAGVLFYIAVIVALITGIVWGVLGKEASFVLQRVVAVIVTVCPHALGVAVPLITSISTTLAAKRGLFIKNRNAFERAKEIKAVVFDKTGTLTQGKFAVEKVIPLIGTETELLSLACGLEQGTNHPIAQAINDKALADKIKPTAIKDWQNLTGKGVYGHVDGKAVWALSPKAAMEIAANADQIKEQTKNLSGRTLVCLVREKALIGVLTLRDAPRPAAKQAIATLKERGIKTYMLTGDGYGVAQTIAAELGIDNFMAEVLPEDKSKYINKLKSEGFKVAMAGDGINDAPALANADLGIAIGAGTDIALESADIVLVKSDPNDVPQLLKLSKLTNRKIKENLVWALAYNILALPISAGVFYSLNFVLPPAVGAIAMALSTIIVALNAMLMKKQAK